jgi:OmpA-OmpF porin, OOP family
MNTKKAITAVLLAFSAPFALAGGAVPQAPTSGFYVGAGIGKATAKDWCSDAALAGGAARCDDKDTAWRFLAGYQINRNFSVEGGYHDLGKVQATIAGAQRDMKMNAWELDVLAGMPVGGIVSIYGKLGGFRAETRGGGTATNIEERKARITFGGGVQADVLSSFSVRAEWQRYPKLGGGAFGGSTDVNVLSMLGIYRF